jgi:bacterial/archaeal transporter family protein
VTWLYLGILSGLLLGVYDLLKKQSVNGNAVLPVLLFSNLASAVVWVPLVLLSHYQKDWLPHSELLVSELSLREHGLLFLKASIVGSSWLFAYFAVKHLPISIAGSVRSTGPVFTIFGALVIYHESPSHQQWMGILITLAFFIALSRVGKREGIHFENNRWIWFIILGTALSACSGLYDKYLLGIYGLSPATVQAWFSIYLFVFMLIPALGWLRGWWPHSQFHWRWSIPLIGLTLLVADFFYFKALANPEAMVSVVSSLRRSAVLITFFLGTFLFKEKHFAAKLPCVLGILVGILVIVTS